MDERELIHLKDQAKEAQSEVDRLQGVLGKLTEDMQEFAPTYEEAEKKLKQMKKEIDDLEHEIDQKCAEIEDMMK